MSELLAAHAAATWFMVGVVWIAQGVMYPLFASVGGQGFAAYHRFHTTRIAWVIGPVLLVEGASAAALPLLLPESRRAIAWAGLGLLVAVWALTAFVLVPLHRQLSRGFDASAHRAMLRWNAVRTAAWTLRGGVAAGLLVF